MYREHAPPAILASHIECFWTTRSEAARGAPARTRVLPDGCADLIFDFSPQSLRRNAADHGFRSYLVGAMTTALVVEASGSVDMLGVRFRPGGASAFLRLPLGELTDNVVEVESLGEKWQHPVQHIHTADSTRERLGLLTKALTQRFNGPTPEDHLVGNIWSCLLATRGAAPIAGLAAKFGLHERTLQRLFHQMIGLTPKETARVARFRDALARMLRYPERAVGRIALESGYYDQSHFTREFVRLAGIAPGIWRQERVDLNPASDAP